VTSIAASGNNVVVEVSAMFANARSYLVSGGPDAGWRPLARPDVHVNASCGVARGLVLAELRSSTELAQESSGGPPQGDLAGADVALLDTSGQPAALPAVPRLDQPPSTLTMACGLKAVALVSDPNDGPLEARILDLETLRWWAATLPSDVRLPSIIEIAGKKLILAGDEESLLLGVDGRVTRSVPELGTFDVEVATPASRVAFDPSSMQLSLDALDGN
jgi:hypothetical protein